MNDEKKEDITQNPMQIP